MSSKPISLLLRTGDSIPIKSIDSDNKKFSLRTHKYVLKFLFLFYLKQITNIKKFNNFEALK